MPGDVQLARGQIEPNLGDAWNGFDAGFDLGNAAGAARALDLYFEPRRPARIVLHEAGEIGQRPRFGFHGTHSRLMASKGVLPPRAATITSQSPGATSCTSTW